MLSDFGDAIKVVNGFNIAALGAGGGVPIGGRSLDLEPFKSKSLKPTEEAFDGSLKRGSGPGPAVYGASSLHLTRGMRVVSFVWLQGMVRDAHARSLTFDQTSIQALVMRPGR